MKLDKLIYIYRKPSPTSANQHLNQIEETNDILTMEVFDGTFKLYRKNIRFKCLAFKLFRYLKPI